jgi:hypothetical protein
MADDLASRSRMYELARVAIQGEREAFAASGNRYEDYLVEVADLVDNTIKEWELGASDREFLEELFRAEYVRPEDRAVAWQQMVSKQKALVVHAEPDPVSPPWRRSWEDVERKLETQWTVSNATVSPEETVERKNDPLAPEASDALLVPKSQMPKVLPGDNWNAVERAASAARRQGQNMDSKRLESVDYAIEMQRQKRSQEREIEREIEIR